MLETTKAIALAILAALTAGGIGYCIAESRIIKRLTPHVNAASRYRRACIDVMTWCNEDEFKPARMVAAHLLVIGDGLPHNAGTPANLEPCDVMGLRTQLREINREAADAAP